MNSDVNWYELVSSIVLAISSIIFATLGSGGWATVAAVVLSVIGAIISIIKAVIYAFDHDRRKAYQRDKTEKILNESGNNIYSHIEKILYECNETLRDRFKLLKDKLIVPTVHVREITLALNTSISKFKGIKESLKREVQ